MPETSNRGYGNHACASALEERLGTIDKHFLAGDVTGFVAHEECDQLGDLMGGARHTGG
jgi:hypothetical protein